MSRSRFGTIIQIGDVLVSEDVVLEYFACDYEKCRGACCIAGDSGAPLKEEELEKIEREYPVFSSLMLPEGLDAVSKKGFFDIDRDGDIVTPLIEGSEACAYAHFMFLRREMLFPEARILLAVPDTRNLPRRREGGPECPHLGHMQGCPRERTQGGYTCVSVP